MIRDPFDAKKCGSVLTTWLYQEQAPKRALCRPRYRSKAFLSS